MDPDPYEPFRLAQEYRVRALFTEALTEIEALAVADGAAERT